MCYNWIIIINIKSLLLKGLDNDQAELLMIYINYVLCNANMTYFYKLNYTITFQQQLTFYDSRIVKSFRVQQKNPKSYFRSSRYSIFLFCIGRKITLFFMFSQRNNITFLSLNLDLKQACDCIALNWFLVSKY